jgi:hypothetical protein
MLLAHLLSVQNARGYLGALAEAKEPDDLPGGTLQVIGADGGMECVLNVCHHLGGAEFAVRAARVFGCREEPTAERAVFFVSRSHIGAGPGQKRPLGENEPELISETGPDDPAL